MMKNSAQNTGRPDAASRTFGDRIRSRRERLGHTLEQFSRLSGVSRAMLSKVERGEKSPTIGIAKRIAHSLDTPLSVLMADEGKRQTFAVVARNQRQTFRDPETGFERHLLSPIMAGLAAEVVLHRLPPRASTGRLPYPPGTAKHVLAARGSVVVGFDDTEVTLEEGDSLYFEASHDHWFENRTEQQSEYYLVISRAAS